MQSIDCILWIEDRRPITCKVPPVYDQMMVIKIHRCFYNSNTEISNFIGRIRNKIKKFSNNFSPKDKIVLKHDLLLNI